MSGTVGGRAQAEQGIDFPVQAWLVLLSSIEAPAAQFNHCWMKSKNPFGRGHTGQERISSRYSSQSGLHPSALSMPRPTPLLGLTLAALLQVSLALPTRAATARWTLTFKDLPPRGLRATGEGDLNQHSATWPTSSSHVYPSSWKGGLGRVTPWENCFFMSPYLRAKQRCVGTAFSLLGEDRLRLHFIPSGAPSAFLTLTLDGMTFIADKRFQGALYFPFRTIISPRDDEITSDKVDGKIITLSGVNGVCKVVFEVTECISADKRFHAKAWR